MLQLYLCRGYPVHCSPLHHNRSSKQFHLSHILATNRCKKLRLRFGIIIPCILACSVSSGLPASLPGCLSDGYILYGPDSSQYIDDSSANISLDCSCKGGCLKSEPSSLSTGESSSGAGSNSTYTCEVSCSLSEASLVGGALSSCRVDCSTSDVGLGSIGGSVVDGSSWSGCSIEIVEAEVASAGESEPELISTGCDTCSACDSGVVSSREDGVSTASSDVTMVVASSSAVEINSSGTTARGSSAVGALSSSAEGEGS